MEYTTTGSRSMSFPRDCPVPAEAWFLKLKAGILQHRTYDTLLVEISMNDSMFASENIFGNTKPGNSGHDQVAVGLGGMMESERITMKSLNRN